MQQSTFSHSIFAFQQFQLHFLTQASSYIFFGMFLIRGFYRCFVCFFFFFFMIGREQKRGEDGFHNGICGELGIKVDGRSEGKGSEVQGARLQSEGQVREDEGDVELPYATLWVLDIRTPQFSACLGCTDQPSGREEGPL